MDKWEYKNLDINDTFNNKLNELGEQGWELVTRNNGYATFKRKKNASDNMKIIQQMFNELIAAIKSLKPAVQAKTVPSPAQSSGRDDFKLPLEAEKERNKKELRDLFLKNAEQRSAEGR